MKILLILIILMNGFEVAAKKPLLKEYKKKRDFSKTPEPTGVPGEAKSDLSGVALSKTGAWGSKLKSKLIHPIYVIQKHSASHLHYDLRLEIEGTLKSWAVPKGPSLNTEIMRLAMPTEDHPIDYANFEGVIPEGYGAGTVMVWDIGTFENLKDTAIENDYKKGKLEIYLHGKKLKGGYVLIRSFFNGKVSWLLKKLDDKYADPEKDIIAKKPKSALTNRTLEQIHDQSQSILSKMRKKVKHFVQEITENKKNKESKKKLKKNEKKINFRS